MLLTETGPSQDPVLTLITETDNSRSLSWCQQFFGRIMEKLHISSSNPGTPDL